jgi:roadblock/LC7 domain-containing protein
MANLDRLMKIGGAVAAGEFAPNGELVSYKGGFPEETAALIAKLCAANSLMGETETESLTRVTGMNWRPCYGWTLWAGDYSLCVIGHIGVCVETAKANFNDIYKILSDEAHVPLRTAA